MKRNFNKSTLENGLRFVTESVEGRASVHLGLHIMWGSRNEPKHMSGAAHLIEHMVFKGTQKRSAYDIVREIEAVGGEIGASTGKEMTSYTVQCLKKDMPLALDILADLVFSANFKESDFVKEKDVVLSEIEMNDENFEESVFDLAFAEVFPKNSLGRPILGTKETVSAISCEELYKLYQESYSPEKMVLSLAGDVDHKEILTSVESAFVSQNSNLNSKADKISKADFYSGTKFLSKKSEQAHLLVSFKAPAYSDSQRYAAYIVNIALGGGMTSILYQKIREDLGLAYSVYSYLQCFLKEGVLSLYVATKAGRALETLDVLLAEVNGIIEKGLSEEQFILYKEQLLGEVIMGQDDLDSRMNSIAVNEMIFGKYRSPEWSASEIEKLKLSDVNTYIKGYMDSEPYILILGPKPEKGEVENERED